MFAMQKYLVIPYGFVLGKLQQNIQQNIKEQLMGVVHLRHMPIKTHDDILKCITTSNPPICYVCNLIL